MAKAKLFSIHRTLVGLICCWLSISAQAQSAPDSLVLDTMEPTPADSAQAQLVKIDKIFLLGNHKTKDRIILRELSVLPGDVVNRSDLDIALARDKEMILNTRLFLDAKINVIALSDRVVDIVIQVTERWYIFPIPIFKLADRNFNDWWVNQNHDFSRVNYGLKFYHRNFRGRGEKLKLTTQFGYTKNFGLDYSVPYVDAQQRNGIIFSIDYSENKNLAYRTIDHQQEFFDSEDVLNRLFDVRGTWSHRYSFNSYNYVTLGYTRQAIGDTIASLNPNYFLDGRTKQRNLSLSYLFRKDLRDNVAYPLHGTLFNFQADKLGLGFYDDLNTLIVSANYSKYVDLKKNYYLSALVGGTMAWPKEIPYLLQPAVGFRPNFIRGHELSLIQGQSVFLNKITLKKLLFSGEKKLGMIPFSEFQTIPFAIYLKTFFDSGVVNAPTLGSENKRLTNQYLFGTGIGLDIVTYYDVAIRLEYSFNDQGRDGFFINARAEF